MTLRVRGCRRSWKRVECRDAATKALDMMVREAEGALVWVRWGGWVGSRILELSRLDMGSEGLKADYWSTYS